MKQLAIIGPTASGKSDLALFIAQKLGAYILSIDSLSIYKDIDIVAAKPSKEELEKVKHFGVDFLSPDGYFSVDVFIDLYKEVSALCKKEGKNLVIVGGTSFYLKMLLDGLSPLPKIIEQTKEEAAKLLQDLPSAYALLKEVDPEIMEAITPTDSYRIEKMLLIYIASGIAPSAWFKNNPPKPIIKNLPIYNIGVERELLRERIALRTQKMVDMGLIDEVCMLEHKYTRAPNAMGAIGIVEVLEYLDGKVSKEQMVENIITHTAQLAKRQQTFNRTQFQHVISLPLESLQAKIIADLE
ncbi:MAG: tRNA (adenosine(37)-N6)-dimethylallyltransferase MiaA [Sulfurimonadaceae bacterium]|jgi:tRNA dimethylallyltransferase|nr:tRNA (adenosine(37)-N6)-dimethylallyltransferase MiaA [Sulfurimonadaceae bacterium]